MERLEPPHSKPPLGDAAKFRGQRSADAAKPCQDLVGVRPAQLIVGEIDVCLVRPVWGCDQIQDILLGQVVAPQAEAFQRFEPRAVEKRVKALAAHFGLAQVENPQCRPGSRDERLHAGGAQRGVVEVEIVQSRPVRRRVPAGIRCA